MTYILYEHRQLESEVDVTYISEDKRLTMKREKGIGPNKENIDGHWVFRKDGLFVDHDWNRNDLSDRSNIRLVRRT